MSYKLGPTSILRLQQVHPDLVRIVERAIVVSEVDFTVLEGARTKERQAELLAAGATTTLNSRHIPPADGLSRAVDLGGLVGGKVRWDWSLYFTIAEAMQQAAKELGIPLEWGGVWDKCMSEYEDCSEESAAYIIRKKAEYKKKGLKKVPFIDGPHFQLPLKEYPV
jgi:peptidoglycan L-alanyl-D-glutamate endopeptidase CwlK